MQRPVIVYRRRLVWLAARWCLVGLLAGAVASAVSGFYYISSILQIRMVEPVVERASQDFSVIRIPFEVPQFPQVEMWCHLVLDHAKKGWMLRC